MPPKHPKILVIPSMPYQASAFKQLDTLANKKNLFDLSFLYPLYMREEIVSCHLQMESDAKYVWFVQKHKENSRKSSWKGTLVGYFVSVISAVNRALQGLMIYIVNDDLATKIKKKLLQIQPDVIILPEDNFGTLAPLVIHYARQMNIPSVILPYTFANAAEFSASYYNSPHHNAKRTILHRLTAWLLPSCVTQYKDKKLLRMPPGYLWLMKWRQLIPSHPWVLNSGYSCGIAVESPYMRDFYLREGLPENFLRVTGTLNDDELYNMLQNRQARQKELCDKYDLDPQKPILLCAVPPDQLASSRSNCEFDDYEKLLLGWVKAITETKDWNVLLSLHPRCKLENPEVLENLGCRILSESVFGAIPFCDLYIASVSATIRSALACGIPVINYDVYNYNYEDYRGAKAVIHVNTLKDFRQTVTELSQPETLTHWRKLAKDEKGYWGLIDGKSTQRLLEFLNTIADKYRDKRCGLPIEIQPDKRLV